MPQRVSHGARVELLRAPGDSICYRAEARLGDRVYRGQAIVDVSRGTVSVSLSGEGGSDDPPAWVEDWVSRLLRLRLRDREAGWPRRITRWRAAPGDRDGPP